MPDWCLSYLLRQLFKMFFSPFYFGGMEKYSTEEVASVLLHHLSCKCAKIHRVMRCKLCSIISFDCKLSDWRNWWTANDWTIPILVQISTLLTEALIFSKNNYMQVANGSPEVMSVSCSASGQRWSSQRLSKSGISRKTLIFLSHREGAILFLLECKWTII